MRQLGKNPRPRGRGGNRRGNNYGQINRHTTLDSNGPGVRLRGNALQLYEKYVSLGNEAASAGERITAEAHYQHADHYFRVHQGTLSGVADQRRMPPHATPATPARSATPVVPATTTATTPSNGASESTTESANASNGKVGNGLASDTSTDKDKDKDTK